MNKNIRIENTADGSHTLYVPDIDEHYHSVNGAIQESIHIFIKAGLQQFSQKNVSILEIGFGTGLNAYQTLLNAEKSHKIISYTAFELYPVAIDVIQKLNYTNNIESASEFYKLHECKWNESVNITSYFSLKKLQIDVNTHRGLREDETFDLIYFDAFAPEKQPEMWTPDIFNYLYKHTNPFGILVTYCAKGAVRRMMQDAGFIVERLSGPPGKREILRARKS